MENKYRKDFFEAHLPVKMAMDKNSTTEDQRRGVRKGIIGEILWSYTSDQDENISKGAIRDESESGLSILTLKPVKVGSMLRIYCKDRDMKYATVTWCMEEDNDIYKSGLLFAEQ